MATFAFCTSTWHGLERAFALEALNIVRSKGYDVELTFVRQDRFHFDFNCGCGRRQDLCCRIKWLDEFGDERMFKDYNDVKIIASQICDELKRHEQGEA